MPWPSSTVVEVPLSFTTIGGRILNECYERSPVSIRVVDPSHVRWFHVMPISLTALAAVWLVWLLNISHPQTHWLWDVLVLVAVAVGVSFVVAHFTANRVGFGADVATWLWILWGKTAIVPVVEESDLSAQHAVNEESGVGKLDLAIAISSAVAISYLGSHSSQFPNVHFLTCAMLAAFAAFFMALLPGVSCNELDDWSLRLIHADDAATEKLTGLLRNRIGDSRQYLRAHSDRSTLTVLRQIRDITRQKAVRARNGGNTTIREYRVRILRSSMTLEHDDLNSAPEEIAVERIVLPIDNDRLHKLRQMNLRDPQAFQRNLQDHIVDGRSDEIFELCVLIEALFRKYNLNAWDRLQTVLGFCQKPNIEYVYDDSPETQSDIGTELGDYCRYPLETLADGRGDCDCHSALAACLFYTLGYDACIFTLHTKDRSGFHMAVGVRPPGATILIPDSMSPLIGERRYFYCETTGSWSVGRLPEDMDPHSIEVWWPRGN